MLRHADHPGERLVACRNPRLAAQRARTREDPLQATEALVAPIRARVEAGRLRGAAAIGLQVGGVLNRHRVRKHFVCAIQDDAFAYRRNQAGIDAEAGIDGVHVIHTSLAEEDLAAADCVRRHKSLARVERAFRTLRTTDLQIRPIHHRLAERTRTRDPVAPAEPSDSARRQKATRQAADGTPLHSFRTLLADLATVTRNVCRPQSPADPSASEFELDTQLSAAQARAIELLRNIPT